MTEFKKFTRDEWFKLTKEEQDFYTFEFNKSVEKRKRLTIFFTRGIAIILIIVMVFIGYAQYKTAKNNSSVLDKYGVVGYCYLCGEYAARSCSCNYIPQGVWRTETSEQKKEYFNSIATGNVQACKDLNQQENLTALNFLVNTS